MPYWAVARAVPHHDRLAAECVGLAGYETFVPKIRIRVGAQWRTTPLFVGYFFVRIVDQWRVLERTMGVFNVVKNGTTPSRCPDVEIAKLIERAHPDGVIRLGARPSSPSRHEFTPGSTVAIAAGPFQGFSAIYRGMSGAERELILLDLLGRQTPVTIAAGLLAPSQGDGNPVDRQQLIALRDAIDMTLALPDSLRELLAQWLAPEEAKPNGHDRHPPAPAPPPPRALKTQFIANPAKVQAAERRLLAALRATPGASVNALAKAAGANRSSTGERLRRLAGHGMIEKDAAGRWKLREEPRPLEAERPTEGSPERPMSPPSS